MSYLVTSVVAVTVGITACLQLLHLAEVLPGLEAVKCCAEVTPGGSNLAAGGGGGLRPVVPVAAMGSVE
jgi:hypothetical protein